MELIKSDTITNISTTIGRGAISIIRLSGSEAFSIMEKSFLSFATKKPFSYFVQKKSGRVYGFFYDSIASQNKIDEVLILIFYAPRSYTGEDLVEIHSHGGQLIPFLVIESLQKLGARVAYPGEFTKRAYLNGRMDLTQVEAVKEIIDANNRKILTTALSHLSGKFSKKISKIKKLVISIIGEFKVYIDYPDEDLGLMNFDFIKSKLDGILQFLKIVFINSKKYKSLKQDYRIAILGKPNVGKSSFFNFLIEENRSIVSSIPGTTRDYLEKEMRFENFLCTLVDTAGIRLSSEDPIEVLGQKKIQKILKSMDYILWILDYSKHFDQDDKRVLKLLRKFYPLEEDFRKKVIIIVNKLDLAQNLDLNYIQNLKVNIMFSVSIKEKINLKNFKKFLSEKILDISDSSIQSDLVFCNLRQERILVQIKKNLQRVRKNLQDHLELSLLLQDMEEVLELLSEITGKISNEEIYDHIFKNFCLGK